MEFSKTFFLRMKKEKLIETAVSMGLTNEYSVVKYGKPANKLVKTQLLEWIETIGRQQQPQEQLQQLFSQLSIKPKKKMSKSNIIDNIIECVVAGSDEVSQPTTQPLYISVYEPLPEVPQFQKEVEDVEIFAPPPEFSDATSSKKNVTFDIESLLEKETSTLPKIDHMTSPMVIYPTPAIPPIYKPSPVTAFSTIRPVIFPPPAVPSVLRTRSVPPSIVTPLTTNRPVIFPPPAIPPTTSAIFPPPAIPPTTTNKSAIFPPPAIPPTTTNKSAIFPPPAIPPTTSAIFPPMVEMTSVPPLDPKTLGAIPKVRGDDAKPLKSLLRAPSVFESPSIFDIPVEPPILVLKEPEEQKLEPVVNIVNPPVKLVTPRQDQPLKISKKKEDILTQILNAKDVADVLKAIRNPNTVHISSINQVDYNISRTFGLCY